MIDPQDLPLDEMSLASKVPMPASPSWRDLWTYQKETHRAFHPIADYHTALKFFILGYPKLREILTDWSNN